MMMMMTVIIAIIIIYLLFHIAPLPQLFMALRNILKVKNIKTVIGYNKKNTGIGIN